MQKLVVLLFCFLTTLSYSQELKKVVYLDTLGNAIDLMESMAIRNTGKYIWIFDENDPKTRYVNWRPTSEREYDSLRARTYTRLVIPAKIGTNFNYLDFVDINGVSYSKDKLKGKVVIINYWFVGCGPCELEMPALNKLVDSYKNNNEVIFISFAKSSRTKIVKFLNKKSFKYP